VESIRWIGISYLFVIFVVVRVPARVFLVGDGWVGGAVSSVVGAPVRLWFRVYVVNAESSDHYDRFFFPGEWRRKRREDVVRNTDGIGGLHDPRLWVQCESLGNNLRSGWLQRCRLQTSLSLCRSLELSVSRIVCFRYWCLESENQFTQRKWPAGVICWK